MERTSSTLSRRNILAGLAGVAVTAVVATTAFRPSVGERARRVLASNGLTRRFLSLADAEQGEWQAQVGSVFSVEGGYRMRLAGVRPLQSVGARPPEATRDRAFVAVFEVADGMTMAGDLIYTATHPQYGRLPLFLSASGDPRRMLA
ncbi:MAG: hypothetical protein M3177_09760, partial [Pseudomonadota bacterium]|nr:hypothetical protein [Pseudomonadota bacterium]